MGVLSTALTSAASSVAWSFFRSSDSSGAGAVCPPLTEDEYAPVQALREQLRELKRNRSFERPSAARNGGETISFQPSYIASNPERSAILAIPPRRPLKRPIPLELS